MTLRTGILLLSPNSGRFKISMRKNGLCDMGIVESPIFFCAVYTKTIYKIISSREIAP